MRTNVLLLITSLLCTEWVSPQAINGDYKAGAINIALPKTPESQGFEKFGNIPVNEVSGTANISIPVYTLKGRYLEVPITLSYNASGIRVNQEASWVGLGFDLVAGGRITVDVKGCIDNDGITSRLFSPSQLQYGMQKLFHRLGDSSNAAIFTFASTCQGCDTSYTHNIPDDWGSVNAMAEFGLGEPDIFHANFLGQSLTFYFDKVSGNLKFLGEKSLVNIQANKDSVDRISDWTITDNRGIKYYFTQKETTQLSLPSYGGLFGTTSTTGWLLTKILHPSGDTIAFTYANYGNSYPAFTWSASVTSPRNASSDADQNYSIQSPMYLTKIESSDAVVDFILGSRIDLKGAGSKRLDEIRVTDKIKGLARKKISFSYDYFTSTQTTCYSNGLADSLRNYALLRLKLAKLYLDDSALLVNPYQFYYYRPNSAPNKYSFAQDHWGYYNGESNNYYSCSPQHLIPAITDVIGMGSSGDQLYSDYTSFLSWATGYNANRTTSALDLPTLTMDSIVYPTGGSTKLIYEPHDAANLPAGGGSGLRVKTVRDYSFSRLTGATEYSYSGGVFMGNICYQTVTYALNVCPNGAGGTIDRVKSMSSSNGYTNDNDLVVGYGVVTQTQKDSLGRTNGYLVKSFATNNPRNGSTNGFNILPAHWPDGVVCEPGGGGCQTYINSTYPLFASVTQLSPTPVMQLDGKLMQEQYFDSSNNLVKSINYYYHQAEYSNTFYSVKAVDNRPGGADASCPGYGYGREFDISGARRFTVFVSPAKSYYTVTDSVIERTYQGANSIFSKKSYLYNSYYQPEYVTTENSDSTRSILLTKTYLSYLDQALAVGDYSFYGQIKSNHFYDLPLEQVLLRRAATGDTVVTLGTYIDYDGFAPRRVYRLETNTPLSFRSQFSPATYVGSGTISFDSRYRLRDSASYTTGKLLKDLVSLGSKKTVIWDSITNTVLAQGVNAKSADVAYSSFESLSSGNWSYTGTPTVNYAAPTGTYVYSLGSGQITRSGLDATQAYVVSYWSRNGAQNVNGAAATAGTTVNGWTYYEHLVTGVSTVTVSGTGTIDELRLYPKGAMMTTYTYEPLVGLSSQCDVNNRVSYYDYDALNRLAFIRDQYKNILKKICYNYAGQAESCSLYGNVTKSGTFTRNNCGVGYIGGSVSYTIPASTYFSFSSQGDADAKAQNDVDQNGQSYANANGSCTQVWYNTQQSGSFTPSNCGYGYSGVPISYTVAANTYSSTTSQAAADQLAVNDVNANGQTYANTNGTCTGTGTISMMSAWTKVTSGMSATVPASGSPHSVSYYVAFYYTTGNPNWGTGTVNTIATVSSNCRPSSSQQQTMSANGCTWRVTVNSGGYLQVERLSGTAPTNQTVISLSGGYYSW
jgi:hypothetical protein